MACLRFLARRFHVLFTSSSLESPKSGLCSLKPPPAPSCPWRDVCHGTGVVTYHLLREPPAEDEAC